MEHKAGEPYFVEDESYEEEPEGRGIFAWLLILGLLIATGSGSAFAWRAFVPAPAASEFQSPAVPVAPAAKPTEPGEIEALKLKFVSTAESTEARLAAQQAEIKRLTDQVAAMSGRLDHLQKPETAISPPVQTITVPKKRASAKPAPVKPVVQSVSPPGPISTGGSPLQPNR